MKPDERAFLAAMQSRGNYGGSGGTRHGVHARDLISELGIPWKRGAYLCQKWTDKGWYDYGVAVDLGWLTDKGMTAGLPAAEDGNGESVSTN